jgi:hypothetical protein
LTTLPTTQSRLHFASSPARATCHRSSTCRCRSFSPSSHVYHPSAQWYPRWWNNRPSFTFWTTYQHVNSCKKDIFEIPQHRTGLSTSLEHDHGLHLLEIRKITNLQTFEIETGDDSGICPKATHELACHQVREPLNLSYTLRGHKNYWWGKQQWEMAYGHARSTLKYFQNKMVENPSFQYGTQMDIEEKIANIFWKIGARKKEITSWTQNLNEGKNTEGHNEDTYAVPTKQIVHTYCIWCFPSSIWKVHDSMH